jgi:hypothetical protein
MEKEVVEGSVDIPIDFFKPLVEKCIGYMPEEEYKTLLEKFFPMYYIFKNETRLGRAIVARGMFDDDFSLLTSSSSLMPFKTFLRTGHDIKTIEYWLSYNFFNPLKNTSFSSMDLMNFEKSGVTDREILGFISEDSKAYFYWCMLNINNGKRIGKVPNRKGIPEIDNFYELDMQEFFPHYNELKAYSVDLGDFLRNAPKEELEERLLDLISDFKKDVKNRPEISHLASLLYQIGAYAYHLNWSPEDYINSLKNENPVLYNELEEYVALDTAQKKVHEFIEEHKNDEIKSPVPKTKNPKKKSPRKITSEKAVKKKRKRSK